MPVLINSNFWNTFSCYCHTVLHVDYKCKIFNYSKYSKKSIYKQRLWNDNALLCDIKENKCLHGTCSEFWGTMYINHGLTVAINHP